MKQIYITEIGDRLYSICCACPNRNMFGYHDDGRRASGVNEEFFNSDSDEEVAFDLSEYKSLNQVDVDVKALLKTRNPTNHES